MRHMNSPGGQARLSDTHTRSSLNCPPLYHPPHQPFQIDQRRNGIHVIRIKYVRFKVVSFKFKLLYYLSFRRHKVDIISIETPLPVRRKSDKSPVRRPAGIPFKKSRVLSQIPKKQRLWVQFIALLSPTLTLLDQSEAKRNNRRSLGRIL